MSQPETHTLPPLSAEVRAVFDSYAPPARAYLTDIRRLIYETASSTQGVGKLTETLKWGEPSYLTHAPKSGTTIRLGWKADTPTIARLFVHCQTGLIETWRAQYTDTFTFEGNRALALDLTAPLPRAALRHCIAMALTYHTRKT